MSYYSVINPPAMVNGMPEDISVVLANFTALQNTVNFISNENIAANAGIELSKLEPDGTFGGIVFSSGDMQVPGFIHVGEDIWARYGDSPVGIGHVGPASQPGVQIAGDTYLYRTGAGVLETNTLHATNLQELSEKGVANGYAPLDGTAHVPVGFIPDISATYQTVTQKGQSDGYASLDSGGKVPTSQLPPPFDPSPYQARVEKGQPNGYAPLDASSKVPMGMLPPSATLPTGGGVNQVLAKRTTADYDMYWITSAGGGSVDPLVWQAKDEKAQANGYASLDATGKVPTAQLPPISAGGADLEYNGDFPTGSPFTDGDIVVYNGIAYMCVRPTSAAPTPWPIAGSDLSLYQTRAEKDQPNGYVGLDASRNIITTGYVNGGAGVRAGVTGTAGVVSLARPADGALVGTLSILAGGAGLLLRQQGSGAYIALGTNALAEALRLADDGKLVFQTDTNLYRVAAAALKTDGAFIGGGQVYAGDGAGGATNRIAIGANGPSSEAGIRFGSAGDANLYRSGANTLKTDGVLNAVGGLQINGVPVGGGVAPGTELAYGELQTALSITAGSEGGSQLVVAASAFVSDGTPVIAEFYSPRVLSPNDAVNGTIYLQLWEGGAVLCFLLGVTTPVAGQLAVPALARRKFTPTAGSHTYSIRAYLGTGTVGAWVYGGTGVGSTYAPAYIRVTKV